MIGSTDIPPAEVWSHLFGNDGSINDRIIDQLRLPRALSAFAVGGLLALAGALMQVLLRNPLGDPYVLGVSGGSATAVLGAMLLGTAGLLVHAGGVRRRAAQHPAGVRPGPQRRRLAQ